ncbi:Alpha/Beta hydrolase protein [Triangularia setosa]|uniref:Carboxylic ester hydrolase n=1 Tax=Triangularia setosa TaxID=2587417 RepID=A0AAN6W6F7_9PEZI|nr:Alpha/Beta hydrolase protein [Podospora setosa]
MKVSLRMLGALSWALLPTATLANNAHAPPIISRHQTSSCSFLAASSLTVDTSMGTIIGTTSPDTPCVRRFLSIPFAQPPVSSLRFLPPKPLSALPTSPYNATEFGPSCMQFLIKDPPTIYTQFVNQYNLQGLNMTSPFLSEDCLSLSVYAPPARLSGQQQQQFPVIIFIHGGAFTTGGQDIPYQIPANWVQSSQEHIVVTFNYRLNIFGFPNAAAFDGENTKQNPGLLDQKMAIQWVKDHISNFGGDPDRITLWGHSAGAISAAWYQYAAVDPSFPQVQAIIMDSGTEIFPLARASTEDVKHGNFSAVATEVGCGGLGPEEELECMQNADAEEIEEFLQRNMEELMSGEPFIYFTPVVDNRTVFGNYTDKAIRGKILNVPTIIGTNADDGLAFVPLTAEGGVNSTAEAVATATLFFCPAVQASALRIVAGVPVYRYYYTGNFSNISPEPFLGAYHSAELPLLFGTDSLFRGPSTPEEEALSEVMQDSWVALAKGGQAGLEATGWPRYDNLDTGLVREFGQFQNGTARDGKVPLSAVVRDVSLKDIEGLCPAIFDRWLV